MLIDSHIHLDSGVYSQDLDELLLRAKEAGVNKLLTPGTTVESSKNCIEIAQNHGGVYAAAGVHPHDSDSAPNGYLDSLSVLLSEDVVVAIGEIGLDFNKNYSEVESQLSIFNAQIKLAKEKNLPMIIHNRDSDEEMENCLRAGDYFNGVIHCYTGSVGFAEKLLSMGFYLGFTGIATFGIKELENVIKMVPDDRLLVETDGPYMTPAPHRGKRNEPAYVEIIAKRIAELREVSYEEVSDLTTQNCLRLFEGMNDNNG
ncbi:MAG: TatD family hydrolase [Candidatus Marinimicrobia bacterium]|nr:TatD family hydrolase [Candidatus Neomarinimicrobiota bacterium]